MAYSGDSKPVLKKHSLLAVFFGPGLNPGKPGRTIGYVFGLHPNSPHHFSGSLAAKIISNTNKTGPAGEDGSVTLSLERSPGGSRPALSPPRSGTLPSRFCGPLPTIAILSS